MASGERRLGTGRRGMTVLGKIPTPSVPKPINLPSQRLENRGLEPNVDLVPRGTFSWGSAGRSNAAGVSKEGAAGITCSPPASSGAWNGAMKIQGLSASGNDPANVVESNRPSSAGNDTRPSSAPTTATNRVWGSGAKTQVEVQVQSSGFTVNPVEPAPSGSKENTFLIPQQNNVLSNRPTSADGTVIERDLHAFPGINAHASFGSGPSPGPEGFQHPGDGYIDRHPFVWQGMPPAGGHELPVGAGPYSGPLPHELYYSPFGVPHHGNMKDRDMLVVRMVSNPGVYGSYPPHLRPAECFGRPDIYGSYRPQTGHAELSCNSAVGASSCAPGMNIGFFPDGNNILFQEGGGMSESGQGFGRYRDGQFGPVPRDGGYPGRDAETSRNLSSMSMYGSDRNHRMQRNVGRHNYASGEGGNSVKERGASFAMQVPEKKITLLTKIPRGEAPSTENIINDLTLPLDCNQGKEGCQQKTEVSESDVKNESQDNVSTIMEVKGIKKADETLEIKKMDGAEVKRSPGEMSFCRTSSEHCVAVNTSKDNPSEFEAAVSPSPSQKTWRKAASRGDLSTSSSTSSSTQKLPTSTTNENVKDLESKVQLKHHFKSDADSHGRKTPKQARKGAFSSVSVESVAVDFQAVCMEPAKPIVPEDMSRRDDQKPKTKALNHKSDKEWRPKSPVVEAKLATSAPVPQAVKGGKRSEQVRRTDPVNEESCSAGSVVVLDESSLSRIQKLNKRQVHKKAESWSVSASNSNKEAPFLLIDDLSVVQSRIVEDQPSEYENEITEASSNGACDTVRSAIQVFNADASNVLATEGLLFKGDHKAKPRQLNQKGEKEWRPKSPAVDNTAASHNVSESLVSETPISVAEISSNHDSKIAEQEGLQPLDTYDYEGQRAKLKEIAAQRAKQRQKEEEERSREQKAKALAKLEELNRRTLPSPTSGEVTEDGSEVFMDEVPNKKSKRKLNSSKLSSADVTLRLEKQQIREDVWAPIKNSSPVPATTALKTKNTSKVGEDSKEVPRNEVTLCQSARNKRGESDRNSSKIAEKHQVLNLLTVTSSNQEQRHLSAGERSIHQQDLASVHDTEVESSSTRKFGVEIKRGEAVGRLRGARQEIDSTQNQIDRVAPTYRNERKNIFQAVEHQEHKQPSLSPVVARSGTTHEKGGVMARASSRLPLQSSVEDKKPMKVREPSVPEELPFAIGSPDSNKDRSFMNIGVGEPQQLAGSSLLGQKHRSKMERSSTIEQVQSFEMKQAMETTVSSDTSFGSEKFGRSHVSWRQKNVHGNHLSNSDKPIAGLNKDMQNALEETVDTPSEFRKPQKVKHSGKQSSQYLGYRHQQGQVQVEAKELCVVEERTTAISDSAVSEFKHEVELKASEIAKIGRGHNSWRQKNITNGSFVSKQACIKELKESHSESLAATEEVCEEIVDPTDRYAVSTSQSSNPHNLRGQARSSPRAAFGAPPWHRNRSLKLSNAILSQGQAGAQVSFEEHTPSQVASASRHQVRASVPNMQGWENEQLQEIETLSFGHPRKRGSQFQADPSLPNAQDQKHPVYTAKVADTISDQHLPPSGKSRFNHTHTENRKINRQHQAMSQAFRPREQHHEAPSEMRNNRGEQRPSRGRDKPSRQSQFNGCSTVAELDRRGAEPAIKTEISY